MPGKSKDHSDKPNAVEKKRKQHPMLWVFSVFILVIIVVTFVGAPILTRFGQQGGIVFGFWDGKPIEYRADNYFSRQRDMVADRYQSMFQQSDGNVEWQLFQVWNSAFELTVVHTAIMEQAENSGLRISEEQVDKALTYYPGYQENGKFSAAKYRNTSNSEKYSVRNYYKESLLHQQWVGDVFGTLSSSAEKDFIVGLSSPERNFLFVAWNLDEYPADQVALYGMEKSELFSEGSFSRITLGDDKKAAEAILSQLENESASFEELARSHSTDIYAEKGGEMGYVMRYALQSDIENDEDLEAVFSLGRGETSGLVSTPYGLAIYQSNGPVRAPDFSKEETVQKVRSYMLTNERGIVEDYFIEKASSFSAQAEEGDFSEAASEMGMNVHLTDYFPINYGSVNFMKGIRTLDNVSYLQSVGSNERILKLLFSLEEEKASEPQIVGNNVIVFELMDEREAPESITTMVAENYRSILDNITDAQVRRLFLGSDKLENNFMEMFSTYFLNQG